MIKTRLQLMTKIGIALIVGITVMSCNGTKKEPASEQAVNVKTLEVGFSSGTEEREYVGTVECENSVDLSFEINGNIEQIYVQEGQSVSKGQLLAKLNPTTFQNIYLMAKSGLDQAKDAYDRLAILHQNNSLPEIKFIEAQTHLEQARANEQIAKKNLNDCVLYAPHAGVIGKRFTESGANVMPGVPVLSLMNISTVKIKVSVPENDIAYMKLGEVCQIKISALNNAEYQGKIIEKGIVANPISHTYDIKLKVNNESKQIVPGMVCKAYLTNVEKTNGIVVPIKAVQVSSAGKNFVWIVDKTGKAEYREVVPGNLFGNNILISNGLSVGDMVVVEGYQNLSKGVLVKAI